MSTECPFRKSSAFGATQADNNTVGAGKGHELGSHDPSESERHNGPRLGLEQPPTAYLSQGEENNFRFPKTLKVNIWDFGA